jgi:hypothetical protein
MLHRIYDYAPWAIGGYNGEIQHQWNKNRAAFIAAVDQRRSNALR